MFITSLIFELFIIHYSLLIENNMNNNIKNTFRNGLLAIAGLAAMYSCTDTWDEHYDSASGVKYNGTTMQAIQEKAPNFAKVLKAAGYDRELNSENVYTVWAPEIDAATAEEYISMINSGKKDYVVKKFIKSHIARYNISLNNEEQNITLINTKRVDLGTAANPTFGSASITAANLSCNNGVLHIINQANPYSNSIYELIEEKQMDSEYPNTLYKFLAACDSNRLDEEKSVFREVNANGQREYVDSVFERWNRALSRVDALIYEEDSNYTAIVPTPEAYQKRYDIAKSLLKFNPEIDKTKEGTADSLQNYYANMFAMMDIYFNNNANLHQEDSLTSTLYSRYNWEEDVFYKPFSPDGILGEGKYINKYECSNGVAYEVDQYPMSVTESFFNRIKFTPSDAYTDRSVDENNKAAAYASNSVADRFPSTRYGFYPHVMKQAVDSLGEAIPGIFEIIEVSRNSLTLPFTECSPSSTSASPKYSFKIPSTLSGTYEIQLVTVPWWFANTLGSVYDDAGYRFYAFIWEKQNGTESGNATAGQYPSSGTRLVATDEHASGNYIVTKNTKDDGTIIYTDTISLGEYTFKNAYYGQNEEGVILQIAPQVTSTQMKRNEYTKNMAIAAIILKPKFDENGVAVEESKRR